MASRVPKVVKGAFGGVNAKPACLAGAVSAVLFVTAPARAQEAGRDCAPPERPSGEVTLDPACVYRAPIELRTSRTRLDCRGALIDLGGAHDAGIRIGIDERVRDIVVRDCRIRGARNSGVVVGWLSPASVRERAFSVDERYERATRDVTIENVVSEDNENAGIYVLAYTVGTRISGSTVRGNGGAGIYLAPSSTRAVIERSTIERNGLGTDRRKRSGLGRREGVAIDSSSFNTLRDNRFVGNGGGVYLYRNCQENARSTGGNFRRWMASERNEIADNVFTGSFVGVWIASRQSRDMSLWDCGEPYYADGRYALDEAPGARVLRNRFEGAAAAIVVEDDGAEVRGNVVRARQSCVVVGTGPRSVYLNRPVAETSVEDNSCEIEEGSAGYLYAYGAATAGFAANRLGDGPAEPKVAPCPDDLFPFKGLAPSWPCGRAGEAGR